VPPLQHSSPRCLSSGPSYTFRHYHSWSSKLLSFPTGPFFSRFILLRKCPFSPPQPSLPNTFFLFVAAHSHTLQSSDPLPRSRSSLKTEPIGGPPKFQPVPNLYWRGVLSFSPLPQRLECGTPPNDFPLTGDINPFPS